MPCGAPQKPARQIAAADIDQELAMPRRSSWQIASALRRRERLRRRRAAWRSVHRLGELDVEPGDAAGVMGRQHHLHRLVDVAPFRVMVALFGDQRGAGHEAEGLVEILEGEGALDRLAARRLRPARKFRQCRFPCLRRQPFRHDRLHVSRQLYPNTDGGACDPCQNRPSCRRLTMKATPARQ